MKMEAETGGTQPQSEDRLEPPGAGRGRENAPLKASGGTRLTGIPTLRAAFQNAEKTNCCCFRPRSLEYLVTTARGHQCVAQAQPRERPGTAGPRAINGRRRGPPPLASTEREEPTKARQAGAELGTQEKGDPLEGVPGGWRQCCREPTGTQGGTVQWKAREAG